MSALPPVLQVIPSPLVGTVSVPSSKSYTNRALLLAALSRGTSTVRHPLRSDDAEAMTEALRALGVSIDDNGDVLAVHGSGCFGEPMGTIDCRDSGTTIRFLTAAAALADIPITLSGSLQLQRRPLGPLLASLRGLGVEVTADRIDGCPPVTVCGPLRPGPVTVDAAKSSQYASALLMALGATGAAGTIVTVENMVSEPYVDMTLDSMAAFGVTWAWEAGHRYRLESSHGYEPADYAVEFDASAAGHILAAAAISGGRVVVAPATANTRQPDFRILEVLERMGCRMDLAADSVTLESANPLKAAGVVDMRNWPDMLSTVAVLAAFADGATEITGVAHARGHETDRVAATATELRKMGVVVVERPDGLTVYGGRPHGASICTYGDHRMAMSFAAAGAGIAGILIEDPACVKKTYPGFWDDLAALGVCWETA